MIAEPSRCQGLRGCVCSSHLALSLQGEALASHEENTALFQHPASWPEV